MSTVFPVRCKCAVCGAENEYSELASTNAFGSSDLDLRPPEMKRSTMIYWVQECPECGYISGEVSDPTDVTRQWLKSDRYVLCDNIPFLSDLAKRFYRYYLINLRDDNPYDAFFAAVHAAWACDDENDVENAKRCREVAVKLADLLIEENHKDTEGILLMRADLMRRSGQFDELIQSYEDVHFEDELLNQILHFQIEKARSRDTACYDVEDATGTD